MRKRTKTYKLQCIALLIFVFVFTAISDFSPAQVKAYEVTTHSALTELAVEQIKAEVAPQLHDLGLPNDFSQRVGAFGINRTVLTWMSLGSIQEDDTPRFCNHFHDPLRPVKDAGLFDASDPTQLSWLCPLHESSIAWQQRDIGTQGGLLGGFLLGFPQDMSWKDAREYLYRALTGHTITAQQTNFMLTFLALGHVMHLVQDASVPAHVRNDAHGPGNSDIFHAKVEKWYPSINLLRTLGVEKPSPTLLQRSGPDSAAPLPIANLVDTDIYTGTNPDVTIGKDVGVAEFANANFFSSDTIPSIFSGLDYANPDFSDMPQWDDPLNGNARYRMLIRNRQVFISHAVRESVLNFFGLPIAFYLDDAVYKDYAAKLLPRAVGYSSALLPYFFRGSIDATANGPNQITITNTAPVSTAELLSGQFELYYDTASGDRHPVDGARWSLTLAPGATSAPLNYTAPTSPAPAEPDKYILVFRGAIGLEADGVAGKVVQLIKHQLNINRVGAGGGTVTSDLTGINCGSSCSANFLESTTVSLTATADATSAFVGWEGDCSGTAASTQVILTNDRNCSARFIPAVHITTGSLPNGVGGANYTAQVSATGGAPPYQWSGQFTIGGYPTSFGIDKATGKISGVMPGCAETTCVIEALVTVVDSAGTSDVRSYTFTSPPVPYSITITGMSCTLKFQDATSGQASLSISGQTNVSGSYIVKVRQAFNGFDFGDMVFEFELPTTSASSNWSVSRTGPFRVEGVSRYFYGTADVYAQGHENDGFGIYHVWTYKQPPAKGTCQTQ